MAKGEATAVELTAERDDGSRRGGQLGAAPRLVSSLLTTRDAAAYCGFKTTGALRKARLEGRIWPAGRRGGTGTWMWGREELDRFLRGEAPAKMLVERPGAPPNGGTHGKARELEVVQEQLGINEASAAGSLAAEGGRSRRARTCAGSVSGAPTPFFRARS